MHQIIAEQQKHHSFVNLFSNFLVNSPDTALIRFTWPPFVETIVICFVFIALQFFGRFRFQRKKTLHQMNKMIGAQKKHHFMQMVFDVCLRVFIFLSLLCNGIKSENRTHSIFVRRILKWSCNCFGSNGKHSARMVKIVRTPQCCIYQIYRSVRFSLIFSMKHE